MRYQLSTVLAVVLMLLASGCGTADSADQLVVEAITSRLSEDPRSSNEQARCFAVAVVSGLGGAASMQDRWGLSAGGISAGANFANVEMQEGHAYEVSERVVNCDPARILRIYGSQFEGTGEDFNRNSVACLNRDEDVHAALVDAFAAALLESRRRFDGAQRQLSESIGPAAEQCNVDLLGIPGQCVYDGDCWFPLTPLYGRYEPPTLPREVRTTVLDQLPAEVLDRLPQSVIEDLESGVLDRVPEEFLRDG